MAKRSFICLYCGQKYTVNQEVYQTIRSNPICEHCRQKNHELPPETETNREDTFLSNAASFVSLLEQGIQNINRISNDKEVLSGVVTLDDAPVNPDNMGSTWLSSENTLPKSHAGVASHLYNIIYSLKPLSSRAPNWEYIGCLGDIYDNHKDVLSKYSNYVGLYMHKIHGQIMYIGRAVEYNNGGFRKRLSDYCRNSDSARKHPSGQKIYANRYRIQTYLMVVGCDYMAAEKTKLLEKQYIALYNPPWNEKLKEV